MSKALSGRPVASTQSTTATTSKRPYRAMSKNELGSGSSPRLLIKYRDENGDDVQIAPQYIQLSLPKLIERTGDIILMHNAMMITIIGRHLYKEKVDGDGDDIWRAISAETAQSLQEFNADRFDMPAEHEPIITKIEVKAMVEVLKAIEA